MSPSGTDDDPVPPGLVLDLDEAFRVLEALEDARFDAQRDQRRSWASGRAGDRDPDTPQ